MHLSWITICLQIIEIWAWNICKIFSLVLSKNLLPEKNLTNKVFDFPFLSNEIDQNINFAKFPSDKWPFFVKTVNFITQKSKSKHFICLSFLCCQGFLRERDKIFYTYSGPWASHTSSAKIYSPNYHHPLLRAPLDFQTLRRPCGDITSCEIQKHSTGYEKEKNIVSTIAIVRNI